ncbi:MAG: 3-dehydroquinate synthase [Defluviitaleaceae bacterium]|nr:3-dehydroquinate synthase [Defluviitaleaceae bacterium]
MNTLNVKVSPPSLRSYEILIENGLIANFPDTEAFKKRFSNVQTFAVISDDNVFELYAHVIANALARAGFSIIISAFPPGESSKSMETYFTLQSWLAEKQITRTDAIIALGGGVVGDLAGFVAATYLRGVPFIQIPTTLLAMVDSSVGGKTAVDIPAGKNLVGAFHQPGLVVCDPDVLKTLPDENFADGMAESIKHGMICSKKLIKMMNTETALPAIIAGNVKIKRDIVQRDPFDTGERQLLNFGHTIGHAIEKLSGFGASHGNAVAIGMAITTRAAVKKGESAPECLEILLELLEKYNLPTRTDFSPEEIFEAALTDKKRAGSTITEIIPRVPGVCELVKMPVDELFDRIQAGMES